jgi:hypothetical protein
MASLLTGFYDLGSLAGLLLREVRMFELERK